MQLKRKEDIEEALGIIWHFKEGGKTSLPVVKDALREGVSQEIFDQLKEDGLIIIKNEEVELTENGAEIARDVTRRHRLAERLLIDVLGIKSGLADEAACQIEHILSSDVADAICSLLGHPKECPHGSKIPAGSCCKLATTKIESIVTTLVQLNSGEDGTIAYILTGDHPQLHKLLSFGLSPGSKIHIHQTFPSLIIQTGETQLALESDLAKKIYIRKT